MLSKMKIRDKLLVAFGCYILLAVVLGSFAYKELLTITKRMKLVELADDITSSILEVRRYEKNYLLFKDGDSLRDLKGHLGGLKKNIDNIRAEIIKEIGSDNYGLMKKRITEYEDALDKTVLCYSAQGELVKIVIDTGRTIENKLSGRELRIFLVLRRYEKNLMLYKDKTTYDIFTKTYSGLARFRNGEIARYRLLVDKLFRLYGEEKNFVGDIRLKAREIQSFTENLSNRERTEIEDILKTSTKLLLHALLTVILLGTIINIKLAMSIATPLKRLERITKKISMGDFSEEIEVKGEDEIASLEVSFNQMEEKLKDAMRSLEFAIERLQEKQAQLVEAEKLASIGILAAGIAHEINNPLTSVLTFSNLLIEQCPEGDPRREKLMMMARDTERARNIVKQLLSFAKEAPVRPVKADINQPVSEVIDSLRAQGSFRDIETALDFSPDLPDIYVDPALFGQVVLNILLNAIHAIIPPGKIEVSTRLSGDFVEITFSDTGRGIPEEHIGRIFDPFFTTKEVNKGTGLGLAVSYGIIKKHGGDIEVKSVVGKGSSFIIRLPVTPGETIPGSR